MNHAQLTPIPVLRWPDDKVESLSMNCGDNARVKSQHHTGETAIFDLRLHNAATAKGALLSGQRKPMIAFKNVSQTSAYPTTLLGTL
jgi:hypothetical protein